MLNVQAAFGHEEVQSFLILLGLNNKGGMDDDEFFEYLQKSMMKLYPDAAPVKESGSLSNVIAAQGGLIQTSLGICAAKGFYFTPASPTRLRYRRRRTKVLVRFSWPSEQTYNLQLLIDEQLREDAPRTLSPWIDGLVVFGLAGNDADMSQHVGTT
jgi:hypothetical protein